MSDWKADKNLGPWQFTEQGDKWGYLNNPWWVDTPREPLNYTGRESLEPQIWSTIKDNEFDADTDEHVPCGHWHKGWNEVDGTGIGSYSFVNFYELLNSQVAYTYLNTYDEIIGPDCVVEIPLEGPGCGTTYEYEFEVIAMNNHAWDVYVSVVDSTGYPCSSITIPAGTVGGSVYTLFRFTEEMDEGSGTYYLKVAKPAGVGNMFQSSPPNFIIGNARIKLRQYNAERTRVQVLLIAGPYNYALISGPNTVTGYDPYPYSIPVGWPVRYSVGDPNMNNLTSEWGIGRAQDVTTIWRYTASELDEVETVTFAVGAIGWQPPVPVSRVIYLTDTNDIESFHLMLYWAPAGTSTAGCTSGTPGLWVDEDQVHVDGCTGATFTPIPDSLIEYSGGVGYYNLTVYPNFTHVPDDAQIYVGGEVSGALIGIWGHLPMSLDMDAGGGNKHIISYFNCEYTSDNSMDINYKYVTIGGTEPTLTVALWNLTSDEVVVGSELEWAPLEHFVRKTAEIELAPECEYEVVCKAPGSTIGIPGEEPQLVDAQLLIDVYPINELTLYKRIGRSHECYWDNWDVPYTYGGNGFNNPSYEGSRSICARAIIDEETYAFIDKVYLESTAWADHLATQPVIIQTLFLEEYTDDSTGAATAGTDLTSVVFDLEETRQRKRSGEITVVAGNLYGIRMPAADSDELTPNNTFMVMKLKEVIPEEDIIDGTPEGDDTITVTHYPGNTTVVTCDD